VSQVHDKTWSNAEQAGTDYGAKLGYDAGLKPDQQTSRWFTFTQIYRGLMRNEDSIERVADM
jgi:hypothetical protein